ncbi:MAG: PilZ domain-containing protein [Sphingomicrobium sp.]
MASPAHDLQPARRSERKRILMRGTVYSPAGAFVVWIRDFSAQGALVAADDPLPTDCDVIFKRGALFAAAHVAWSNDSGAGLKFYRELSDSEVSSAELPLPHRDD